MSLFFLQPVILQQTPDYFIAKIFPMNELVDRLSSEAGLTAEQAKKAIQTIGDFVKERFPMLGGAVDQIFADGNKED